MSNSFSNYDTHENKSVSKEKKIVEVEKEIKEVKNIVEIKAENNIKNTTPQISLMEVLMVMGIGMGLIVSALHLFHKAQERQENLENKTIDNETTLEQKYTDN